MQVKKQLLELDMEKQIGSKLEKEYIKAVYQGVYQGWQYTAFTQSFQFWTSPLFQVLF